MVRHLKELFGHCQTIPVLNQFELNPYNFLSRNSVVDFCQKHDIQVESYSPLAKGMRIADPKLVEIAKKYDKTPAQILIRWALEHNFVVIPKTVRKARIHENADVFDFCLSPGDMAYLDGLDENLVTSWDPTDAP